MSDGGYSEDFENYDDDDFEAEEDYEVLPKAMTKPTTPPVRAPSPEPVAVRRPNSGYNNQHQQRPPSAQRPLHIPTAPQQTDAEARAARKRLAAARKKMEFVQLEVVAMDDLFVAASLSEYELFSMARGVYANNKAAAVQTNDDAREEEVQTEEVPARSYASQAPEDRDKMTEAEVFAFSVDASAPRPAPATQRGAATARMLQVEAGMEVKLASFMQWAGPVMLAALGMAPGGGVLTFGADPRGGQGMGAGMLHLEWAEVLANRPVTAVSFSPGATDSLLLVAYGPVGAQLGTAELIKDHTFASKGLLCVWDLTSPSRPRHLLACEGAPTCAAWGPPPATNLVFAGMEEGGVCAWDLEEPGSRHPAEVFSGGAEVVSARRPSYTTEGSTDPITAGRITGIAAAAKEGGSRSAPCTIVSLGAWGDVAVYTASLLAGAEGSAADMDLGMRIGSRVRLLRHAGTVRLGMAALQPPGTPMEPLPAHCLALLGAPREKGQMLAGSDGGRVLRGSWVGTPPAPKEYIADDATSQAAVTSAASAVPSTVTFLAVSPFHPKAFLAGHGNGTVCLHSTSAAAAVLLWPEVAAGGVAQLVWSPTRPACFYVLDAACTLHHFDLTQSLSGPVTSEAFMGQSAGGVPSLTTTLAAAGLHPNGKVADVVPCFALGYDDGGVDVHVMSSRHATCASPDGEMMKLVEILGVKVAS